MAKPKITAQDKVDADRESVVFHLLQDTRVSDVVVRWRYRDALVWSEVIYKGEGDGRQGS